MAAENWKEIRQGNVVLRINMNKPHIMYTYVYYVLYLHMIYICFVYISWIDYVDKNDICIYILSVTLYLSCS